MAPPAQSSNAGVVRYLVGDIIADKYRLDGLLGEGGMGAVWRAFNLQLEAPVALKLIRTGLDREVLSLRLRQEARAAAKLGHPGIVRVFDIGETKFDDPFIVMELLSGESLAALLHTEQRLSAVRAVQLLLPVADALSAAHGKGIIHRDLKPDNVFIATEGGRVQPKLLDFGIVKLSNEDGVDARLTEAGTVLGSPAYMSPEQARGLRDLDHRTDIWSFSVVLYETLSGGVPFKGANYHALLRAIVEDDPPSLLDQCAGDPGLWEIIQRGLAKQLDRRFQTMTEVGQALAAWLLAQGLFEDASGGSLEAKWTVRSTDPNAARASRASFASLSSPPPHSGLRAVNVALGSAPTLGFVSTPSSAVRAPQRRARGRLLVAAIGLPLLVLLALALGWGRRPAGSLGHAAERAFAPATALQPAASAAFAPPPTVAEPSAHLAPLAVSVSSVVPSPVPQAALKPRPARQAGSAAKSPAIVPKRNNADRDLLAPY